MAEPPTTPESAVSPVPGPTNLARHACASCKQRKRKCDKILPACGMCTKKYLKCEYTTVTSPSSSSTLSNEHYSVVQEPAYSIPSKFPAVFFLDADIFQRGHLEIPKVSIPVPFYVREVIGDDAEIRNAAYRFFDTIHTYFPIISKQRFYSNLMNPLAQPRADVALLVLCMRLVTSSYSTKDVRMASLPEYFTAKKFYAAVEAAGTCSTQVLQAGILIAFYEFGHAIYPAAYLSIGTCARYGVSYGMDESGFPHSGALNWIEAEEKRRVWWAVLILDRCINLGNPTRSLTTQEPLSSSCLPMEDETWDKGQMPLSEVYTVASPTSLKMGRFGRFAQATYLLGRVLKHVSDRTPDREFLEEEATQLRHTLHALVNLIKVESQISKTEFCTQSAMCWAGMLLLQGIYGHALPKYTAPGIDCYYEEQSISESIAREIHTISKNFLVHADTARLDRISPFMFHLLYHSRIIWTELHQKTGTQTSLDATVTIYQMMGILGERWKAGEAYLEILRARELTQFY